MAMHISGRYRDKLKGKHDCIKKDYGWHNNLIVNNCDKLLAARLRDEPYFQGIQYLAIGEGNESWDEDPGTPQPNTPKLESEIDRLPVTLEQMFYRDNGNIGDTPTNILEINVQIVVPLSVEIYHLREFGLFGGNATEEKDTGYLINYVIHPRIDLATENSLTRTIQLTFQNAGNVGETVITKIKKKSSYIENVTVEKIDGVGAAYAAELNNAGITTIAELANIDPTATDINIPKTRFIELCSKARITINIATDVFEIPELNNKTLAEIITTSPQILASETGAEEYSIKEIQQNASALQLTLDNKLLKQLTMSELMQHD